MPHTKHPGLPIPEDWDGQSWCQFAICWPDSLQWRAILAGFVTTPMLGRTWDADTGSIIDTQAIGRLIFENNLDWRYALVSSCDNGTILSEAIRYLADRLASTGCCNAPGTPGGYGTGGAGSGAVSPVDDITPEGDPPAGYDTWEEYYTDACKKSWWLINTVENDINSMTFMQLVGVTVVGLLPTLAALFLDPIPGDELILLAGVIIALAAYGEGALSQVKESFSDAKSDIVCSIFNAVGPDSGKSAALSAFRTQIESDTADPVIVEYGVQLVGLMLSYNGLNKVYSLQTDVSYPAGDTDCDECTQDIVISLTNSTTLEAGDLEGVNLVTFTMGGYDIATFGFADFQNDSTFPVKVTILDLDSWTNRAGISPVNWLNSQSQDSHSTMGVAPDYRTYDVAVGGGWQLRSGGAPITCQVQIEPYEP